MSGRPASTTLAVELARLGPIGRIPFAPGTWGSLAGIAYFALCFPRLGPAVSGMLAVAGALLAVPVCSAAEKGLGRQDPGEVVLDEFTAIPWCFLGWEVLAGWAPVWALLLAGFLLFRVFDILKPFGIRHLQHLPGGWGVVADDVAAALATCALLHAARWAWGFAA